MGRKPVCMQKQPGQRPMPRFFSFLQSSRGQLFATWCAYSALSCLAMGMFLTDYSRLVLPLMLISLLLSYVGVASHSRRNLAQVVLALWIIPVNVLAPALFDLGDQA